MAPYGDLDIMGTLQLDFSYFISPFNRWTDKSRLLMHGWTTICLVEFSSDEVHN